MKGKIFINGIIGEDTSLIDVISQVKKHENLTSLDVEINSIGGFVDNGFEIYDYLRGMQIPITTIATSECMSIATVIFMAGDIRKVMPNTSFMIHAPHAMPYESLNAGQMKQWADELAKAEKRIAQVYLERTKLTSEEITPLLQNDTFISVEQVLDLGFANESVEVLRPVAKYNLKTDNKMTNEDKSWLEQKFEAFAKKFMPKAKALMLLDANGAEVNFTELEDGATPQVGDVATIDGQPAEGTYVMPQLENASVVFVGGAVTEIIPFEEENTELEEAKAKVAELEKAIEEQKAQLSEKTNLLDAMAKDFTTFKAELQTKFKAEFKKENTKNEGVEKTPAEIMLENINKRKNNK